MLHSKLLGLLFVLIACGGAFAATPPKQCQPLAVQGNDLTFKLKKPTLILIQNTLKTDLWLTHPVQDPGASAGWTSQLGSNHWSAIVLDQDFTLSCTQSTPGHEQQIACVGAVMACSFKKIKFPKDSQGSYWAAENMALSQLIQQLGNRGFKISQ